MSNFDDLKKKIESATGTFVSDADAEECILGFYLKDILENSKTSRENTENVIRITSEDIDSELPAFSNIMSKREEEKNVCELNILNDFKKNTLFLNSCTPFVKIYKVFTDSNNNQVEVEIPFDTIDITRGRDNPESNLGSMERQILEGGSGNSVGITSFDWTSEGKNEGNNSVFRTRMKIVLQSVNELEKVRNIKIVNKKTYKTTLLDMMYPRGDNDEIQNPEIYDGKSTYIKAEVGFNFQESLFQDQNYKDYFKTKMSLYLYKHNFTFHESGKVELDLEHIASVDGEIFDKTKWNILESPETKVLLDEYSVLEKAISSGNYNDSRLKNLSATTTELLNNFYAGSIANRSRQGVANSIRSSQVINILSDKNFDHYARKRFLNKILEQVRFKKINLFDSIIKNLKQKQKIKLIELEEETFEVFKLLISIKEIPENIIKEIQKFYKDKKIEKQKPQQSSIGKNNIQNAPLEAENPFNSATIKKIDIEKFLETLGDKNSRTKIFISLGDLIQELIEQSYSINEKTKINMFLSSFRYIDYSAQTTEKISETTNNINIENETVKRVTNKYLPRLIGDMYDIPISLDSFTRWWNEEILLEEENAYSLGSMLRAVFTKLIPESIGNMNAPNSPKNIVNTQKILFQTAADEFKNENSEIEIRKLSILYKKRMDEIKEKQYAINIVNIFSDTNMNAFNGNKIEDCKKNVMHLNINSPINMIKKTSFKRDDNQKLVTANLLAANDSGINQMPRQRYHCDIEMYGNNFFDPGNLIFISPSYPGVNLDYSTLYKIGLGGYYRIIKIDNKITPQGYTTTLQCRWEMFGEQQK